MLLFNKNIGGDTLTSLQNKILITFLNYTCCRTGMLKQAWRLILTKDHFPDQILKDIVQVWTVKTYRESPPVSRPSGKWNYCIIENVMRIP